MTCISSSQLSLNFEPQLAERFGTLREYIDLLRAQGKDAVVASIRKFEGESKRVR